MICAASLAGCQHQKLEQAATTIGTLAAEVNIPDVPSACQRQYGHVWDKAKAGDDYKSMLRREGATVDDANETIRLCADNWRTVQKNFARRRGGTSIPK